LNTTNEKLDRDNSQFSAKIHSLVLSRNMLCHDDDSDTWKNLINKIFFEKIEELTYPLEKQNKTSDIQDGS